MMNQRCLAEVYDFHRFLIAWFTGKAARDELEFSRIPDVMAEDFQLVRPDGQVVDRNTLRHAIWRSWGAHARYDPPFRIWVENFRSRTLSPTLQLVTYEEWQEVRGQIRGRMSTAIFRDDEHTPNGVVWLHVHETWLGARPGDDDLDLDPND